MQMNGPILIPKQNFRVEKADLINDSGVLSRVRASLTIFGAIPQRLG